ncbi:TatD DNase family Scn1 [Flagelloscypha sp. PMI_526]|nr:TatD DNase family Scn1 [Flagelloscypha sp. PMI_526]
MELPIEVAAHMYDVHCHPTDSTIHLETLANLHHNICAMSTRRQDQNLVAKLAKQSSRIIPCFGYHPWFSHSISLTSEQVDKTTHYHRLLLGKNDQDPALLSVFNELLPFLPDPIPLPEVLQELRESLQAFPDAMVGEVGLDRIFRVPFDYFEEPRRLTPFTLPLDHQLAVLEAQIDLAVECSRNISLHSVKCASQTSELLSKMSNKHREKWLAISIDLHSCGLSPESVKAIQSKHPNVFLSLSTVINSRSPNHTALIASCDPLRLLAESDFNNLESSASQTIQIIQTISQIKGWPIETKWEDGCPKSERGVIRRLEENWLAFQAGNHTLKRTAT